MMCFSTYLCVLIAHVTYMYGGIIEDAITLLDESGYTKLITRINVDDKGVLLSTITTYHLFIKHF